MLKVKVKVKHLIQRVKYHFPNVRLIEVMKKNSCGFDKNKSRRKSVLFNRNLKPTAVPSLCPNSLSTAPLQMLACYV